MPFRIIVTNIVSRSIFLCDVVHFLKIIDDIFTTSSDSKRPARGWRSSGVKIRVAYARKAVPRQQPLYCVKAHADMPLRRESSKSSVESHQIPSSCVAVE
jgi:hypothetical protein